MCDDSSEPEFVKAGEVASERVISRPRALDYDREMTAFSRKRYPLHGFRLKAFRSFTTEYKLDDLQERAPREQRDDVSEVRRKRAEIWMPPEELLPEENPNKGLPVSRKRRLIVFGGSFDPIHRGHIELARKMLENNLGDEVMFIPARQSPLKDDSQTKRTDHRIAMVEAAIADAMAEKPTYLATVVTGRPEKVQKRDAKTGELVFNIHNQKPVFVDVVPTKEVERKYAFSVSDIELSREGLSYTIDTLRILRSIYQDADISFLIGSDCLDEIEKWHKVGELLQQFGVYVYPRKGAAFCPDGNEANERFFWQLSAKVGEAFAAKLCRSMLNPEKFETYDISSSDIRQAIARGGDLSSWLSPAVWKYIQENGLYR